MEPQSPVSPSNPSKELSLRKDREPPATKSIRPDEQIPVEAHQSEDPERAQDQYRMFCQPPAAHRILQPIKTPSPCPIEPVGYVNHLVRTEEFSVLVIKMFRSFPEIEAIESLLVEFEAGLDELTFALFNAIYTQFCKDLNSIPFISAEIPDTSSSFLMKNEDKNLSTIDSILDSVDNKLPNIVPFNILTLAFRRLLASRIKDISAAARQYPKMIPTPSKGQRIADNLVKLPEEALYKVIQILLCESREDQANMVCIEFEENCPSEVVELLEFLNKQDDGEIRKKYTTRFMKAIQRNLG